MDKVVEVLIALRLWCNINSAMLGVYRFALGPYII